MAELGFNPIGIDKENFCADYPGAFIKADLSDPTALPVTASPDLLWLSPPCQAYSKLTKSEYDNPREEYPTFDDLNVRRVIDRLDPDEYIIENVVTCEDLENPTKLNGRAFGLQFHQERWFETSFPIPSHVEHPQGGGDQCNIPIGGCRGRNDQENRKHRLANAKGIPATWDESHVIAAIPKQYVQYLLHYCPTTPHVNLPDGAPQQTQLAQY
ncbi:hypothetical protein [Salinibaculum rarum]|uniref:hypothetical protein n=1 Tax=Salinibaculum rarum TaxID=3058903 RepID=UPI00265ED62F|nr:hypothetical protein [Salinibaculum sp. KK48]